MLVNTTFKALGLLGNMKTLLALAVLAVMALLFSISGGAPASRGGPTWAIFTTTPDGGIVNEELVFRSQRS